MASNFLKQSLFRIKPLRFLLSETDYIEAMFYRRMGYDITISPDRPTPPTFNAKLQWMKLYYRNPLMTLCADKYAVRKFVDEKAGSHILNELYGVFESADEIDFNSFPQSFVLKATHGSGWNIIVKNQPELDTEEARSRMRKWLATNYYDKQKEWCYKDIPPKIVCERYLQAKNGLLPDYKFFCFGGKPLFIQVDTDRFTEHKRCFYNPDWEKQEFGLKYPLYEKDVEKPQCLNEMLEIARALSAPFPFARVDLYEVNGKPVFGEITLYPGNGLERFSPERWDAKLGGLIKPEYGYNMKNPAFLLLFLLLCVPAFGETNTGREDAIAEKLMCPVCAGQSVAESNSELAHDMRKIIRAQIKQEKSDEEIILWFRGKYGDGILAKPPMGGFNLVVWLLPLAALLTGAAFAAGHIRRNMRK